MSFTLIDLKIRRRWRRYALQVSLATATLGAALVMEQALAGGVEAHAVIVAAIASTAFVLFISPESASARTSHALGGHALAILVGCVLALLVGTGTATNGVTTAPVIFSLYAALGVGLTMFLMAMTNTEHPPAAGTALAIVARVRVGPDPVRGPRCTHHAHCPPPPPSPPPRFVLNSCGIRRRWIGARRPTLAATNSAVVKPAPMTERFSPEPPGAP